MESAANGWAYATLQVWKTFTNHMKEFNPHVKFENFNESGINNWVIFLRNQNLEEKSVQHYQAYAEQVFGPFPVLEKVK